MSASQTCVVALNPTLFTKDNDVPFVEKTLSNQTVLWQLSGTNTISYMKGKWSPVISDISVCHYVPGTGI